MTVISPISNGSGSAESDGSMTSTRHQADGAPTLGGQRPHDAERSDVGDSALPNLDLSRRGGLRVFAAHRLSVVGATMVRVRVRRVDGISTSATPRAQLTGCLQILVTEETRSVSHGSGPSGRVVWSAITVGVPSTNWNSTDRS